MKKQIEKDQKSNPNPDPNLKPISLPKIQSNFTLSPQSQSSFLKRGSPHQQQKQSKHHHHLPKHLFQLQQSLSSSLIDGRAGVEAEHNQAMSGSGQIKGNVEEVKEEVQGEEEAKQKGDKGDVQKKNFSQVQPQSQHETHQEPNLQFHPFAKQTQNINQTNNSKNFSLQNNQRTTQSQPYPQQQIVQTQLSFEQQQHKSNPFSQSSLHILQQLQLPVYLIQSLCSMLQDYQQTRFSHRKTQKLSQFKDNLLNRVISIFQDSQHKLLTKFKRLEQITLKYINQYLSIKRRQKSIKQKNKLQKQKKQPQHQPHSYPQENNNHNIPINPNLKTKNPSNNNNGNKSLKIDRKNSKSDSNNGNHNINIQKQQHQQKQHVSSNHQLQTQPQPQPQMGLLTISPSQTSSDKKINQRKPLSSPIQTPPQSSHHHKSINQSQKLIGSDSSHSPSNRQRSNSSIHHHNQHNKPNNTNPNAKAMFLTNSKHTVNIDDLDDDELVFLKNKHLLSFPETQSVFNSQVWARLMAQTQQHLLAQESAAESQLLDFNQQQCQQQRNERLTTSIKINQQSNTLILILYKFLTNNSQNNIFNNNKIYNKASQQRQQSEQSLFSFNSNSCCKTIYSKTLQALLNQQSIEIQSNTQLKRNVQLKRQLEQLKSIQAKIKQFEQAVFGQSSPETFAQIVKLLCLKLQIEQGLSEFLKSKKSQLSEQLFEELCANGFIQDLTVQRNQSFRELSKNIIKLISSSGSSGRNNFVDKNNPIAKINNQIYNLTSSSSTTMHNMLIQALKAIANEKQSQNKSKFEQFQHLLKDYQRIKQQNIQQSHEIKNIQKKCQKLTKQLSEFEVLKAKYQYLCEAQNIGNVRNIVENIGNNSKLQSSSSLQAKQGQQNSSISSSKKKLDRMYQNCIDEEKDALKRALQRKNQLLKLQKKETKKNEERLLALQDKITTYFEGQGVDRTKYFQPGQSSSSGQLMVQDLFEKYTKALTKHTYDRYPQEKAYITKVVQEKYERAMQTFKEQCEQTANEMSEQIKLVQVQRNILKNTLSANQRQITKQRTLFQRMLARKSQLQAQTTRSQSHIKDVFDSVINYLMGQLPYENLLEQMQIILQDIKSSGCVKQQKQQKQIPPPSNHHNNYNDYRFSGLSAVSNDFSFSSKLNKQSYYDYYFNDNQQDSEVGEQSEVLSRVSQQEQMLPPSRPSYSTSANNPKLQQNRLGATGLTSTNLVNDQRATMANEDQSLIGYLHPPSRIGGPRANIDNNQISSPSVIMQLAPPLLITSPREEAGILNEQYIKSLELKLIELRKKVPEKIQNNKDEIQKMDSNIELAREVSRRQSEQLEERFRKYQEAMNCLQQAEKANYYNQLHYQRFMNQLNQEGVLQTQQKVENKLFFMQKTIQEQAKMLEEQKKQFQNTVSKQVLDSEATIKSILVSLRLNGRSSRINR